MTQSAERITLDIRISSIIISYQFRIYNLTIPALNKWVKDVHVGVNWNNHHNNNEIILCKPILKEHIPHRLRADTYEFMDIVEADGKIFTVLNTTVNCKFHEITFSKDVTLPNNNGTAIWKVGQEFIYYGSFLL